MAQQKYVIDACAMIAYLRGEVGHEIVGALLANTNSRVMAHAANLCEVYYDTLRRDGKFIAALAISRLIHDGIERCYGADPVSGKT